VRRLIRVIFGVAVLAVGLFLIFAATVGRFLPSLSGVLIGTPIVIAGLLLSSALRRTRGSSNRRRKIPGRTY
jgi:hypothetical protein